MIGMSEIAVEVIVPHDETNVVYVSYLSVDPGFPTPMRLGVQDASRRSVLAPSEFYTVGGLVTAPVSGTTYRYRLGTNTDPRVTDAEWSVIGQGEAWIRANFARLRELDSTLSAPEDVLAQGYSEWVGEMVGVGLTNGPGHVGIVDYDGEGVAAGEYRVNRRCRSFLDGSCGYSRYEGGQ